MSAHPSAATEHTGEPECCYRAPRRTRKTKSAPPPHVFTTMPVAPWTPYKDPISMDSDGKPDGILIFTTNGSAYNVAVTKE